MGIPNTRRHIAHLLMAAGLIGSACPANLSATARVSEKGQEHVVQTKTVFAGFDIISVKPNHTGSGSMSIDTDDYKFTAENATLAMMLESAYGVRPDLMSGMPAWARDAHWDIRAKMTEAPAPGGHPPKRSDEEAIQYEQQRWQSLLRERFHLVAHLEQRSLPVYDLVVANKNEKLQPTSAPENQRGSTRTHNQDMAAIGVKMTSFAWTLSNMVGRNVIDQTGLTGQYDFHLRWSTDRELAAADNGVADRPPSIYTALQEQLGLKLISGKGPVNTLVVDSVSVPDPD